ncbi:hypothetical protein LF817_04540 [Halobacillus sp. A1]|uniref:hypothetical protein n=1 Tax=Halobacillus sp. A1 TaxID=2880262 RepID=UPI0020A6214B|nr:hypothetical protein [Halobacillus sp. A1]MCP3030601.1 hypothetical protein [Halobacillus sp. A1]
MAEVFDFDCYKSKKEMKKATHENLIYEIYLTTIKYVKKHGVFQSGHPGGHITTDTSLKVIFNEEEEIFNKTFHELIKYWGINLDAVQTSLFDNNFENFATVGDLCVFLEKEINNDRG